MKPFLTYLALILFSVSTAVYAQTPGGVNYQAVARDGSGNLLKNKALTVKAVILTGPSGSNVEYTETHTVTTNDYGLFTIIVGQGSTTDNFGALTWGTKKHHLKIEIDPGSGFVNMGVVPFQAVPYALSAKNVENLPSLGLDDLSDVSTSGATSGQYLSWDGTTWKPATVSSGGSYTGGSGITITGTMIEATSSAAMWNANKLYGNNVLNSTPSTGEVLKWNGSAWGPGTDNAGNYTAGSGITITGSSIAANATSAMWNASSIQGRGVSNTAPGSGQILKWNGTNWAPAADNNGTAYTAGSGLTLTGTAFSANSSTAMWNASSIQGRSVTNTAPSSGQVLKWNGSNWAPGADNGGTAYTAGSGLTLSGTAFSANSNSAMWNANRLQGRNVATTAPSTGQVLAWSGSSWAPSTVSSGSSSPWTSIGTTHLYVKRMVAIGRDTAKSALHVEDSLTGNVPHRSVWIETKGLTNTQQASQGLRIDVTGSGGWLNEGIRSVATGSATTLYNGSGATGGYFEANTTAGQNNFGTRCQAGDDGSVRNYGVYAHSTGNGSFNMGVFAYCNGSHSSSTKTNYGIYAWADSATTNYAGYFAGNVSYTGTLASASDARLKTNIQPFENALSKLKNVQVSTYEYKKEGMAANMNLAKGKQIGFVAQNLEKSFPGLVEEQRHAMGADAESANPETIEYKAVNYIGMIPVLTKAIQEQQQYIELLEKRLEQLELQIAK
tara:strand:+ start:3034 stop:5205 length:2172 start_codon:yes stop_codon:yes gene_type:complete